MNIDGYAYRQGILLLAYRDYNMFTIPVYGYNVGKYVTNPRNGNFCG